MRLEASRRARRWTHLGFIRRLRVLGLGFRAFLRLMYSAAGSIYSTIMELGPYTLISIVFGGLIP